MTKRQPKPDNPEQSARFLQAAKEAGVDAASFEQAFEKMVPAKRKGDSTPPKDSA